MGACRCPTCGTSLLIVAAQGATTVAQPVPDNRERTARDFKERVLAAGKHLTPDGRVSADVAAWLLGVPPSNVKRQRCVGTGPRYYRLGGRVSYRLDDLAHWYEELGSDPNE